MESVDLNNKQWKSTVKRILIIYWGLYGDLIITTPFLEYLRRGFPGVKITYVVGGDTLAIHKALEHAGRILENNPHLNKCIKSDVSILGGLFTEKPYDLVIDLCGNNSKFSSVLSHISGAKVRIWGHFRELPEEFFYAHRSSDGKWADSVKVMLNKKCCRAERFLEIIRFLGVKTDGKAIPRIYLSRKEKAFSRRFFKRITEKDNLVVGMHPGGRQLRRLWNTGNYSLLADRLIKELGAKVVVFYGPGEKKIADMVCKHSHYKLIKMFQRDIRKYVALVSRCNFFITTDGGPLHIALSLGIPSIGIFGNKYNGRYWYGHYPKDFLFPDFIQSNSILKKSKEDVEQVFKKIRSILNSNFSHNIYEKNPIASFKIPG
jgi:ADP-heptose:LPS heptosyltransferase